MRICWKLPSALVFSALLCAGVAFAQQITLRSYGQNDGLSNLSLNALLRDKEGYLWVGSEGGVFRYDGARFVAFGRDQGVPGIIVTSLAEDSDGRVWVGTTDGLAVFHQGRFRTVLLDGRPISMTYGNQLSAGRNGEVYAASTRGRVVVTRKKAAQVTWHASFLVPANHTRPAARSPKGDAPALLALRDGSVLYACDGMLCEQDGDGTHQWGIANGVAPDAWQHLFEDSQGRIWARGQHHIVVSGRLSRQFARADIPGDRQHDSCTDMVEDLQGRILTCTDDPGIARYSNGRWEIFGKRNGLSSTALGALAIGSDGLVWMGLGGRGLQKWIGYGAWEHWTEQQGLNSDSVYGILVDGLCQKWVADDKGLSVSSAGSKQFKRVDLGIPGLASTRYLAETPGAVWVGTKLGKLIAIDQNTRRVVARFEVSPIVRLASDGSGRLWIATRTTLFSATREGRHWHLTPVNTGTHPDTRFYDIALDGTRSAWVATSTGILQCTLAGCKPLKGTAAIGTRFSDVLFEQKNRIWVLGDFPGVVRLQLDDLSVSSYVNFRAPQLRSDNLVFLGKDPYGRIWAGSDSGIDVLTHGRWQGFTEDDGLIWNDCDGRAFFSAADDIYVGTSGGLSRLYYPALTRAMLPPAEPKLSATVEGEPLGDVTAGDQPVLFTFSPLRFLNERSTSYRYRLSGVDKHWVTTTSASVRYAQIPDGLRRFELQMVDTNSGLGSTVTAREFSVPHPPWRTWPFWLLVTGAGVAGARIFWRWRIRALMERQRALEMVVEERTRKINLQLTQEALLKAEAQQASKAKSDFLAMMSHEIRTPMNGVIGMASLLAASPLTGEQLDWVDTIQQSGTSLLSIINDILDFSKVEAGRLELEQIPFELDNIIEQVEKVIRPLAEQKNLAFSALICAAMPSVVKGDPGRVRQILLNLLSNAVKFTESGGVRLEVESEVLGDGHVQVAFRVSDTGIGISEEAQRRLFKRFGQADATTTRKYGGTGLGLAICKRLSELMGGNVKFESEQGKGSVFTFSVRFALADLEEEAPEPIEFLARDGGGEQANGMHVLVAEDNVINRKVASRMLMSLGYLVTTVENGAEAFETALRGRFDAVLMDCQMPVTDGFEATRLIREAEKAGKAEQDRTPIIALTANALSGERQRCLDAGMDDYLSKPINLELLRSTLRQWTQSVAAEELIER